MTNKTLAICASCGAHIKHVHTFNGKTYGGDCVQVAAGLKKWEMRTAGSDIDSYLERKAERLAQVEMQTKALELAQAHHTAENGWIIDFLEGLQNSFADSLARQLRNNPFECLSEKQKIAVQNFWIEPYENIQKGFALVDFVTATEGLEPYEIPEAQEGVASYATAAELKALLKENGIKGYSKLNREALEEAAAPFIKVL